jgi:hypothetical protein
MKRFMVFSFPEYYPSGGLSDVIGDYDTIEEAKEAIEKGDIFISSDFCYVFDREIGEQVFNLYA